MSDAELHDWLVGVGAIPGEKPAFLSGRSDAMSRALSHCGLS